MKWEVVGQTLYVFASILKGEDVLVKEIVPGLYQVTPLKAGAVVTLKEGERFYAFVFSGLKWIGE